MANNQRVSQKKNRIRFHQPSSVDCHCEVMVDIFFAVDMILSRAQRWFSGKEGVDRCVPTEDSCYQTNRCTTVECVYIKY